MKRKAIIITLSIITIAVIVAGAYLAPLYFNKFSNNEATLYIYPNMTKDQLADSIKANLGEDFGDKTVTVLNLLDIDATKQVGHYKIKKNATPYQTARKLQYGEQTPVRFIFNSARTLEQFAEKADKVMLFTKEELLLLLQEKKWHIRYNPCHYTHHKQSLLSPSCQYYHLKLRLSKLSAFQFQRNLHIILALHSCSLPLKSIFL